MPQVVGIFPAVLLTVAGFVILVVGTWDAVRLGRAQLDTSFAAPDPWFVVFLSLVFPPLGYIYLRRWSLILLWLVITVPCLLLAPAHITVILMLVQYVTSAHIWLIVSKRHSQMLGDAARRFFLVFGIWILIGAVGLYVDEKSGTWIGDTDSGSMAPTLEVGDQVVVSRLAYLLATPDVGDIVVISTSRVSPVPEARYSAVETCPPIITKRIVAKGGDTVEVRGGELMVNSQIVHYVSRTMTSHVWKSPPIELLAQNGPYRVPDGQYFVIGDNMGNSFDSRCFGPVPRIAIVGKAVKVVWPLSRARVLK
jgi:signal peptidase I